MISNQQVEGLMSASGNVLGPNGDKIGSVGTFYLDDQTNEPAWVTVNTGLIGTNETFVPLSEATVEGIDVLVPYSKEEVKNAPQIESDGSISAEEEVTLYRYYGFTYDDGTAGTVNSDAGTDTLIETETGSETGTISGTDREAASGGGRSAAAGSNVDDAMTRSEERLEVGTERRETGRARLRKYTVTDTVTTEVPVSHEEVRIEREPITDANRDAALRGEELREDEYEVTLHSEEPVVRKHTEPVERVRLETETVTDTETVSGDIRKEKIDTEVDDAAKRNMSTGTDKKPEDGSGSSR